MFSENEANALITAEQLINKNKDQSLIENYQNAIDKIRAVLKFSRKEKADLLTERIHFRINEESKSTNSHLMTLQSAITSFKLIEIDYYSLQNELTNRIIEPFAVYSTQGNWLLIAFCRLRNEFRAFRIDHIKRFDVKEETFESHQMTLEEYFKICKEKYQNTPDTPLS